MAQGQWSVSSAGFSYYYSFYHSIVPRGEMLSGSRAREFFLLSNLPNDQLCHIWNLADIDKDGQLNAVEFTVALHLIQNILDGHALPHVLPDELKALLVAVLRPRLAVAKPNQLEKCRTAFISFMENRKNGRTCLSTNAAEYLLTNSQLPKGQLFHIWMLSDIDMDGLLSFTEFAVAMQLIFVAKLNHILPLAISPVDILPEEFFAIARQVDAQAAHISPTDQPTPPSVPHFVQVRGNNPVISDVFLSIPAEEFLLGKFEHFTGNPFNSHQSNGKIPQPISNGSSPTQFRNGGPPQLASNGSSPYAASPQLLDEGPAHIVSDGGSSQLSQDDTSPKSSRSSQASSVRSLVEEREEPVLLQAESVAVVGSREVTPTPDEEVKEGEEVEEDPEIIDKELQHLSERSQRFLAEEGAPEVTSSQPMSEKEIGFMGDSSIMSASSKGLPEVIREISPSSTPSQQNESESVTPQVVSQNGTESSASDRNQSEDATDNDPASDDILAQLENFEAEMMDLLEDTNSFETETAPAPTRPAPVPAPVSVPVPAPAPESVPAQVSPAKNQATTDSVDGEKSVAVAATKNTPSPPNKRYSSSSSRRHSSSESSPEIKKAVTNGSPRRKRSNTTNQRKSLLLSDIDDFLGDELATIMNMEEAFKSKEEQAREREKRERKEISEIELKVKESSEDKPKATSMEAIRQQRIEESKHIQKVWEEELKAASKLAREQYEQQMEKVPLVGDETIQNLEQEFAALLQHEQESMKGAREIRAQRLKEEEERMQRMKEEMQKKKVVTIEEWIVMMEQNKLKEMSPEERVKYENRKKEWLKLRQEKEEKRRREEEEKIRLARERMDNEYRSYCRAEREVKQVARLTTQQMQELAKEQQSKEAEERRMRSENARLRNLQQQQKQQEESKPKARSALAARWEESVKTRSPKNVASTVLTSKGTKKSSISDREMDRLAKHIG